MLREAIARSLPAPADPEREILVTNGAMHALSLTFRALLEPGDEVIVPTPCYFFARPDRAGRRRLRPGAEAGIPRRSSER